MMRILMLITAIVIAYLMGVRFGVGLLSLITDWRLWISAVASVIIWSILGLIISMIFGNKKRN